MSAEKNARMTPTHLRLMAILKDGLPHSREELRVALWDELSDIGTLTFHISTLRDHLRPKDEDVICVPRSYAVYYQHVKRVSKLFPEFRR